jgi:hypothetical protein
MIIQLKKALQVSQNSFLRKRLYMLVMEKISVCRRTQILITERFLYVSGGEKTALSSFKQYECQYFSLMKILQRSYQDKCVLYVSLIWKTSAFRGDIKGSYMMGISVLTVKTGMKCMHGFPMEEISNQ